MYIADIQQNNHFNKNRVMQSNLMIEEHKEYKYKEVDKNALVKQDNKLINSRWKMNVNQSRVFLTAVSMIHKDDKEFTPYRINAKELKEIINVKGNSVYDQLQKDVPKLMQSFISVKTEKKHEWISIVSSAKYQDGSLFIKFSPEMKPYLLELQQQFTVFKLSDVLKFKNQYSIKLYQCLMQFNSQGWRYFTIRELRELFLLNANKDFGIKKDKYPKTYDLKNRIINPVFDDLKRVFSNLQMEEIKEGKRIIAYRYTWKKARKKQVTKVTQPTTDLGKAIVRCLQDIGLSPGQQETIIQSVKNSTYTADYIWETVRDIRIQLEKKNIKGVSKGGYSVKLLRTMLELEL